MNLSTALPPRRPRALGVHGHLWMQGCPSPNMRDFLLPHFSSSRDIKGWCHSPFLLPLFSRISKRRRGVSLCQALQLPGMLPRRHHLIQRQPEQLLLQPGQGQALSLLTQPSTKLCTAQPQPFPARPCPCLYSTYANP